MVAKKKSVKKATKKVKPRVKAKSKVKPKVRSKVKTKRIKSKVASKKIKHKKIQNKRGKKINYGRLPISVRDPWFARINEKDRFGVMPMNFKGAVLLFLLVFINAFGALYFNLNLLVLKNYLKFFVVLLLSLFVFIIISSKTTEP